jgi:hypothetical protein
MRTGAFAVFLVIMVGIAAVAGMGSTTGCTLSPTASDAGADAGSETVGTQCSEIASAQCSAYAMCAQEEPADCITNVYAGCCAGSVCDEISQTSSDTITECVDAYTMSPDCNALANATTPSACSGIPSP